MFDQITDKFDSVFRNLRGLGKITDRNINETTREVRRVLLDADVNFRVARDFIKRVQERAQGTKVTKSVKPGQQFIKIIHDEMVQLLGGSAQKLELNQSPSVILMAGLQGSGKTTSSAKLGSLLKKQGKTVLLVAADVYRPAAIDQLKKMGEKANLPVYDEGAGNPISICKNAISHAKSNEIDVVILDTAGRLHIDGEMMMEIQAIAEDSTPDEILFVADGMTGQDAVNSAKIFNEALSLSGVILTKMDGDARGGAAVSIREVTGKPIKYIGISEKLDGLQLFEPKRIADRILGFGDVVTLVEKAQTIVNEKDAEALRKKMIKNTFDLEDFRNQMQQLKKMGSMKQLMGMMPGVNRKMLKGMNLDDKQMDWTEAIINSMTLFERSNPKMINGSRRMRISKGSGRPVHEINALIKQFTEMQKMMKKFGNMKSPKFPGMGSFVGIN
ncbi:MAG: signal recognition particle protein [Candidatus Marinimicrobia bacterium]|nr:signal recognition particle protein [Candidatus Neomarinimicrobiota bacterium]